MRARGGFVLVDEGVMLWVDEGKGGFVLVDEGCNGVGG